MTNIMPMNQLAKKIVNQEPMFILDVRSKEAFADWKIDGEHLQYLNKPYFELLEGVDEIIEQLPTDIPVGVVCAKGNASKKVSEALTEKGLAVYNLEGGMAAWSEEIQRVKIADLSMGGELFQFVRMGKGCLSYMVISEGEAAVIDPVRMIDEYIEFAREKNVTITHVLDTHLHADHISGGKLLSDRTNATYWLPPEDATEVQYHYEKLTGETNIKIGHSKISLQALDTPGHTIGSKSFMIDDAFMLTGDILFVDSIGRPDLAGKASDWVDDLRKTLYVKYKELSKDLLVLPGHFMTVSELNQDGSVGQTLGTLFETNHGLNVNDEEAFRRLVTEDLPEQPNAYEEIRKVNMGKIIPSVDEMKEMESGPNRCAVK